MLEQRGDEGDWPRGGHAGREWGILYLHLSFCWAGAAVASRPELGAIPLPVPAPQGHAGAPGSATALAPFLSCL